MATQTVRALKDFYATGGKFVKKGAIVELPLSVAQEVRSSNKAEYCEAVQEEPAKPKRGEK